MAIRRVGSPVAGNAFAQIDREVIMPWESYQPLPRAAETSGSGVLAGPPDNLVHPRPVLSPAPASRGIFGPHRVVTDPLPQKPSSIFPESKPEDTEGWDEPESSGYGGDGKAHYNPQSTPYSDVFTPEGSASYLGSEIHPAFRASEGVTNTTDPVKDSRQTNSTPVQYETLPPTVYVQPPSGRHQKEPSRDSMSSESFHEPVLGSARMHHPEAMILGNGSMPPTNTGTYGSIANAQLMAPSRVPSMAGVLEQDETAEQSPSSFYSDETKKVAPPTPQSQPTFRHQLESRLHKPGLSHGTNASMSSLRSNASSSRHRYSQSLPRPPAEYTNPAPPAPMYDKTPETPALLQELFAGIHEQIRSSTNPIKSKLLSNHDDLIDILTRKFDKSITAASDGIDHLNDQCSSLQSRLEAIEQRNTQHRNDLVEQAFKNWRRLDAHIASNNEALSTQIETLVRNSNEISSNVQHLAAKMDDLELRVEASQCRCSESKYAGSSRNAFASMQTPELRAHPAFATDRAHNNAVPIPRALSPTCAQTPGAAMPTHRPLSPVRAQTPSAVPTHRHMSPVRSQTPSTVPANRSVSPARSQTRTMDPPPTVPNVPRPSQSGGQHSRSQSNESGSSWYHQAVLLQGVNESFSSGNGGGGQA